MAQPGTIEATIGLPPNPWDLQGLDLYSRKVEKFGWTQMIPQANEIVATYYYDLASNGSTETGAGEEGDPFIDFASINTVLGDHDPDDVLSLRVRTSPTAHFLRLDCANKVVLNNTTPEILWTPWKGQARFSAGKTQWTHTGWTQESGNCYKRTVVEPGWMADINGYFFPLQWKRVTTIQACIDESYTWYHDGTILYVNKGSAFTVGTGLCQSKREQDSLIEVQSGSGRILIQGVYCQGFGAAYGTVSGGNVDASGIYVSHGDSTDRVYKNGITADKLLLANCADIFAGAHPMSVTADSFGDGDTGPTAIMIDCVGGGGHEDTKGVGPFNCYGGNNHEFALLRCTCPGGPAQASENGPPSYGHSQPGNNIGLYFNYGMTAMDSRTLIRPTGNAGTPSINATGLLDTNQYQRAIVARYRNTTTYSTGSGSGIALGSDCFYNGMVIDFIHRANDANIGRSGAGSYVTGNGIAVNCMVNILNDGTGGTIRLFGDGSGTAGGISQKFLQSLIMLSSIRGTAGWSFGINLDLSSVVFHNCIFAVMDGGTSGGLSFPATNTPTLSNCGFYRCTPPAYAVNPIILNNIEPYIAAYQSELLGVGASVASYGNLRSDGNGRTVNASAPHLGPFANVAAISSGLGGGGALVGNLLASSLATSIGGIN